MAGADFWSMAGKHSGRECVLLGNGSSLPDHVEKLRRGRPDVVISMNQAWKLWPKPDLHVVVDKSQYDRDEKQDGYEVDANKKALHRLGARGVLFTSEAWRDIPPNGLGIPIPMIGFPWTWGRWDQEPRGFVVSLEGSGSVMYVALQLAEFMGFEKVWLCGFDQTGPKFTGESTKNTEGILKRQDWLMKHTPAHVVKKVRVIAPSKTTAFEIVSDWPW